MRVERRRAEIGVWITTDRSIRRIHKRFLGDGTSTDVISFGYVGSPLHGDIVVSADFARRYSRAHGVPFREEITRYLVHGLLHLFGYDDARPAERRRMHARQEQIVKGIAF